MNQAVRRRRSPVFPVAVLLLLTMLTGCAVAPPRGDVDALGLPWVRTELFLGRAIPRDAGGGEVSEADFARFIAEIVTPRFPDGLTIVDATGQYRDPAAASPGAGGIVREPTKLLILLHPPTAEAEHDVEEIRDQYALRFHQKSVLRATSPVRVSFESRGAAERSAETAALRAGAGARE
jgi:hypothetical protein